MRLDHLLSKEHLAIRTRARPSSLPAHGGPEADGSRLQSIHWLFRRRPPAPGLSVRPLLREGEWNATRRRPETGGALLFGPEGASTFGRTGPRDRETAVRGLVCRDLENLIASASIYEFKLVRAYGGCLGARSR